MDLAELGTDFIAQFGLIAIFILLVLDAALLLPVFPGELVLVIGVATYADDTSSLLMLIALTTAASLVGSWLLYGIARGGGRKLIERFPGFFMMPRKRRERLERLFSNPAGQTLVLFMRLLPLTRVLVSIPAGLARMPFLRFSILSTIGLAIYHAAFLWFTYETGREGSALGDQTAQLQDQYGGAIVKFVAANSIVTGMAVLAFGVIASFRASSQVIKDPQESAGSLLGWAAMTILYWGGLGTAALTWLDADTAFFLLKLGGVEKEALGATPTAALIAIGLLCFMLGLAMRIQRDRARKRRNAHKRAARAARRKARREAKLARGVTPVHLAAYDESWPVKFAREHARLIARFPDASVEHFGSTAIPGMVGEPVIDVMLDSDLSMPTIAMGLRDLGYVCPEVDHDAQPILAERDGIRVYVQHGELWDASFKDILLADPKLVTEYAQVKRDAAPLGADGYEEAKTAFIERVLSQ